MNVSSASSGGTGASVGDGGGDEGGDEAGAGEHRPVKEEEGVEEEPELKYSPLLMALQFATPIGPG